MAHLASAINICVSQKRGRCQPGSPPLLVAAPRGLREGPGAPALARPRPTFQAKSEVSLEND